MITTDTGAKKIENSDNWRLIFDAHNDSVDAEDKIVPEMAPIVNGNKSTVGAAIGEYVLVRNSSITGITDGAYTAAKAIPANTTIDSTYLTAVGTGGALNALNSKMQTQVETLATALILMKCGNVRIISSGGALASAFNSELPSDSIPSNTITSSATIADNNYNSIRMGRIFIENGKIQARMCTAYKSSVDGMIVCNSTDRVYGCIVYSV